MYLINRNNIINLNALLHRKLDWEVEGGGERANKTF